MQLNLLIKRAAQLSFCLFSLPMAAQAERVECELHKPCFSAICVNDPIPLAFEIDPNQFAPPVDQNEPPRNKVTVVALGDDVFAAEPILMDNGMRGFWAHVGGIDHLMTIRPDGMGTYATSGAVPFMTANCEVLK